MEGNVLIWASGRFSEPAYAPLLRGIDTSCTIIPIDKELQIQSLFKHMNAKKFPIRSAYNFILEIFFKFSYPNSKFLLVFQYWVIISNGFTIHLYKTEMELFDSPVFECRSWCSGRSVCINPVCVVHYYSDVIMTTIAFQITSLAVVYSIVYSDPIRRASNAENVSMTSSWSVPYISESIHMGSIWFIRLYMLLMLS